MDPIAVLVSAVAGLLLVWVLLLVLLWLLRPKGVPARELLRVVPDLLRLTRSLLTDGDVPLDVRIVVLGALIWVVSPIDPVPEFIPIIGWLDEVIVVVVALRYVRYRLGATTLQERWQGSEEGFTILTTVMGS
jgi:uncharacterized membrane protein YkvA (DUF1232 family)